MPLKFRVEDFLLVSSVCLKKAFSVCESLDRELPNRFRILLAIGNTPGILDVLYLQIVYSSRTFISEKHIQKHVTVSCFLFIKKLLVWIFTVYLVICSKSVSFVTLPCCNRSDAAVILCVSA